MGSDQPLDLARPDDGAPNTTDRTDDSDQRRHAAASRQWRSLWRIHFYSGMFAMPFILLMAVTGLVILYTQPIEDATQSFRTVGAQDSEYRSYDEQAAAVEAAYPDGTVYDLTVPADEGRASRFFVDDGSAAGMHVFVDPYTAEVVGESKPGSGIVGLSNRLHGFLNNETVTVTLPTIAAVWDDGPVWRSEYVLGDLVLEILGIWTLVLVLSGLYLFWPRRSRNSDGSKGKRRLITIRSGVKGRARWRDLHGVGGLSVLIVMVVTIVSGMGWSTYWAEGFGAFAEEVTPGNAVEPPASALGERGDLDRFGNQIPWATGDFPIPASYAPETDGSLPAPLRLDDVVRIAEEEGMRPGYTISFPANDVDEAGNPLYGSFTLYNSWPRKTSEARDVFIDQFSGATLAEQKVYGGGAIYIGMDTLVSTHMGTELGLFTRVLMTALCVLSIWSVISGFVMFWKRRRPGSLGLPRRPVDVSLSKKLAIVFAALALVFPQWGVTALIILAIDRFVIRRVPRLRHAFGQA